MGRRSVKQNKSVYQLTRENLGLTRETASERMVTISPERLERIENEKVVLQPADVLELSQAYQAPVLCNHYCSHDCEIGKALGINVQEKPLAQIALETFSALTQLDAAKARLMEIAVDGQITPDELQDFTEIKGTLKKLAGAVDSLQLWVKTQELSGKLQTEKN